MHIYVNEAFPSIGQTALVIETVECNIPDTLFQDTIMTKHTQKQ